MLTTTLLLAVLIGQLVAVLVLWGFALRLGLRWVRVEGVTWKRVWGAVGCIAVVHLLVGLFLQLDFHSDNTALAALLLGLIGAVGGDLFILGLVFKSALWTSFRAWLPTLVAPMLVMLWTMFVVRPFLFEPFLIPTNSMAPTILGTHEVGECTECGAAAYATPVDNRWRMAGPARQICDSFHVTNMTADSGEVVTGDRIAVAKFLAPRRWDMVVFRFPDDPSVYYVKRVVGLPGETITIADGCVYANGEKLVPPESLRGLEYLAEIPEMTWQSAWGTPTRPAVLGEGEYFTLGDFSAQAADSRYWTKGAPGHPAYAVPESYLVGVVTHTVWPPSRWRVHR